MKYRIWWQSLGDMAYLLYWCARERELPHRSLVESGTFEIATHRRIA